VTDAGFVAAAYVVVIGGLVAYAALLERRLRRAADAARGLESTRRR